MRYVYIRYKARGPRACSIVVVYTETPVTRLYTVVVQSVYSCWHYKRYSLALYSQTAAVSHCTMYNMGHGSQTSGACKADVVCSQTSGACMMIYYNKQMLFVHKLQVPV